jgi:hypothetical protein
MVPYRGRDRLVTYTAAAARKLYRFLCIKNIMENRDMALVSFTEPARPGLQVQDLFTFYIHITNRVVRVH